MGWSLLVSAGQGQDIVSLTKPKSKCVTSWLTVKNYFYVRIMTSAAHLSSSCVTTLCFLSVEGFLFVIGGTDEHKTVLDSGEKYDPDSNTWTPITPMLQVCSAFSVIQHFSRGFRSGNCFSSNYEVKNYCFVVK